MRVVRYVFVLLFVFLFEGGCGMGWDGMGWKCCMVVVVVYVERGFYLDWICLM